ncbi:MAG: hypothetical protein RLZZ505_1783 [Verrucomicrobiota bacterium]|jgi:hypothetical protein
MFRKVFESLEKANARASFRKGTMCCPECGGKPGQMPESWEGLITCPACGAKASVSEWAASGAGGFKTGNADRPPVGTAIRKEITGKNAAIWHIPAKGKFGFFMLFAILWLGITILVSGGFLMTIITGGKIEGNMPEWMLIPFFGIFYAVGIGMFYAGLREKFMRHRVVVGDGVVTLTKQMFGKEKAKSVSTGTLISVSQKEFYQQNYQPIYGIEIKGADGKLRFGSKLSEDEKAWLVADIERTIEAGKSTGAFSSHVRHEGGIGTIKLTQPQPVFSIPIPGPGKSAIFGSLIFATMGVVFFCVGLFVIEGSPGPDRDNGSGAGHQVGLIFSLLDNGFRIMWLLMSGLFAAIGIGISIHTFRSIRKDLRIEGNSAEIAIRTYRRGLVFDEKSFPRSQVTDIRASQSASSNGRPMKRVELIVGDRAEKIANWMGGDDADTLVTDVRNALGIRR